MRCCPKQYNCIVHLFIFTVTTKQWITRGSSKHILTRVRWKMEQTPWVIMSPPITQFLHPPLLSSIWSNVVRNCCSFNLMHVCRDLKVNSTQIKLSNRWRIVESSSTSNFWSDFSFSLVFDDRTALKPLRMWRALMNFC